MTNAKVCPQCAKEGRISHMRSYSINFEEAVFLCSYKLCTYPYGFENFTIANTAKLKNDEIIDLDNNILERNSNPNPHAIDANQCINKEITSPVINLELRSSNPSSENIKDENKSIKNENIDDLPVKEKQTESLKEIPKTQCVKAVLISDPKVIKNLKLLSSVTKLKRDPIIKYNLNICPNNVPNSEPVVKKNVSRFPKFSFDNKKSQETIDLPKDGDNGTTKDEPVSHTNSDIPEFSNISFSDELLWTNDSREHFDLSNDITDEFLKSLLS